MPDNPLGPWGTSHRDQMEAAIEHEDWPMVAKLSVDGYLHAKAMDHPDGSPVTLDEIIGSIQHLSQHNLVLWCAEALRRLYEGRTT